MQPQSTKTDTLKSSTDFQRIARDGSRKHTSAFILQAAPSQEGQALRVGYTASRKVGNAVVRNRAKRRLREMVRLVLCDGKGQGFDIVLIAKTAAATHDFAAMKTDFENTLRALGVLT